MRCLTLLLAACLMATALAAADRVDPPPVVYVPFDKVPVVDPKGQGVFLPYEQFVKLWDAAHPQKPDDEVKPPTGATLAGYTLTGVVKGDAAELTLEAEVTALAKHWSRIELPAALALTGFTPGDGRMVLERRSDALLVHLPQAGTWRFTAQVACPVGRDAAGRRRIELAIPAAGAGRLDLTLPDAEAEVAVEPAVAFTTTTGAAGKRLLAVLGGAPRLALSWQPPAATVSGEALVLAESTLHLTAAERSLRISDRIAFTVLRRSVDRLAITVPAELQVLAVEVPGLRTWQRDGTKLEVLFHEPAQGAVAVQLTCERLLEAAKPGETRRLAVPLPMPTDAARSTGVVLVSASEGMAATVERAAGLGQVDPKEVAGDRAEVAAAFRFAAPPPAPELALTRLESEVRVVLDQLVRLGSETDLIVVNAALEVRKAGLFALTLRIPATWELAETGGLTTDDVRRGPAQDGWCALELALKGRFIGSGAVSLRFRAAASIPLTAASIPRTPASTPPPAADTALTISVASVPGARLTRGSLTVAAPRSWALATRERTGLIGADESRRGPMPAPFAKELGDDEEALGFTLLNADARLTLAASPRARELIVRQEELLTVADGRLVRTITWRGEVRYNAASVLTVTTPTGSDKALTFKGANLAEHAATTRADGRTTWELRFTAPVLGPFTVSVEEVRELPALTAGTPATVELPAIAMVGATRYQNLLAVAREGSIEVAATAANTENVAPADLPPTLAGAGVVAGFQGSNPPAPVLTLTRHDLVPMPDAAVTAARYSAVVGEDGRARIRGDLLLNTRGRPWLGLTLPAGTELLEAAVDGKQSRASRRTDGSVVVPLATAGGGMKTCRVAFVYDLPAHAGALGAFGRVALAVPVLGKAETAPATGRAGEVRPLPVAGSDLTILFPEKLVAFAWRGDFHPSEIWDTPETADDLTVRVPQTGRPHGLARLGDGGAVTFRYASQGLVNTVTGLIGLAGLLAAWWLRHRARAMTVLTLGALALALLTDGLAIALAIGVGLGLAGIIAAALIRWWHARRLTEVTPDPWVEQKP